MMRRVLTILLTVILLGAQPAPAGAQTAFQPVAIVNDSVITAYDVDQRMRLLVANGARQDAGLRAMALEQLVIDRVRRNAAKAAGLEARPEAVDAAIAEYAATRSLSVPALEQTLSRAGVARASLEDALASEIAWGELIRRRFGARAEPSDVEIEQELALQAAGQTRSFRIAEIVLPLQPRGEAATMALAQQLSASLNGGGDFAAAARRNSASPSAAQGGAVGWVTEGALPPVIVEALSTLRPGEVSPPVPLSGAVALLKLEEIRSTAGANVGGAMVEVVAISASGARADARLQAALATRPTCETADALAQGQGVAVQRSQPTQLAALPPAVRGAVAALEVGEVSAPVRNQQGVVAFVLCSRASEDNPEAREALKRQMRGQRLQGFSNAYIQELRGDAVVELR